MAITSPRGRRLEAAENEHFKINLFINRESAPMGSEFEGSYGPEAQPSWKVRWCCTISYKTANVKAPQLSGPRCDALRNKTHFQSTRLKCWSSLQQWRNTSMVLRSLALMASTGSCRSRCSPTIINICPDIICVSICLYHHGALKAELPLGN